MLLAAVLCAAGCNYQREKFELDLAGPATFAAVQRAILGPKCMACHAGPASPLGADFTSYENLIAGGWVIANDSEKSPLYDSVAKGRMPKNKPALTPQLLDLLRRWIDSGAPKNGGGDPLPPLGPNYPSLAANIFFPRCASCHDGAHPKTSFDVRSYKALMAFDDGIFKAVEPGDPDASSLMQNIAGGAMPPVGGPLSDAEIAAVREWIRNGAKEKR